MFKPNKPADKKYIAGSPIPLWGRHQRDDAAHRAEEEEWTENWYWRSSWGEESRQRPLLRSCLLHQITPVHHSLHRCLLLLPPVRLLPGAHILPPRVHWLWLVPHTHTVRILHSVWEGRWWHPIQQGFSSFQLKPYIKAVTHFCEVEWWRTLMVECVTVSWLFDPTSDFVLQIGHQALPTN